MRLIDQLDGARYIRVVNLTGWPAACVWKGGHGIHAYTHEGEAVDYWQLGGAEKPTELEVERSIEERIHTVWMLGGEHEEEEEEEEEEEAPTGWDYVDTSTEEEAE